MNTPKPPSGAPIVLELPALGEDELVALLNQVWDVLHAARLGIGWRLRHHGDRALTRKLNEFADNNQTAARWEE